MAVTGTSDLTAGLLQKLQDEYIYYALKDEIWGQFANWKSCPLDGGGASAYRQVIVNRMEDATDSLSETSDVTPVTLSDTSFDITPALKGNAAALTLQVRYQTHPDAYAGAGKIVGLNRASSIDKIIRTGVLGASLILRPNDNALRTGLDVTSDKISYDFISELISHSRSHGFEPFEKDTYVTVVPSAVIRDIKNSITLWQDVNKYRTDMKELFTGEVGMLGGVRFIESPRGKLYLSGGTVAQTATTLAADAAAGATTLTVASATGLAAGNYISVGTLEGSVHEQVQITTITDTVILTIRGDGNTGTNFGLKYAHASGAAVTEAANVAAIPIFGAGAIHGRYGEAEGRAGQLIVKENEGILEQFTYFGWRAYLGVGLYQKSIIMGEVAVTGGFLGSS